MVVDLSDALRIPLRERNAIMLAAGYAPLYLDEPLDGPAMRQIGRAVSRLLRQHEPFPAMAMDRYWDVLEANEATPAFFRSLYRPRKVAKTAQSPTPDVRPLGHATLSGALGGDCQQSP